eukprot:6207690-Pleurochrysis_carterae.AAC.3
MATAASRWLCVDSPRAKHHHETTRRHRHALCLFQVRKSLKLGLLTDGENGLSSPASPTPRLTANSSPSLRAAEEDEAGGWPERESGVGR